LWLSPSTTTHSPSSNYQLSVPISTHEPNLNPNCAKHSNPISISLTMPPNYASTPQSSRTHSLIPSQFTSPNPTPEIINVSPPSTH